MEIDKLEKLTNEEFALLMATEIVKTEIQEEWDFSDNSPREIALAIAEDFLQFLNR